MFINKRDFLFRHDKSKRITYMISRECNLMGQNRFLIPFFIDAIFFFWCENRRASITQNEKKK